MGQSIEIRKAEVDDSAAIWRIIEKVISTGETYVFKPGASRKEMLLYWYGNEAQTYVATLNKKVVGTFIIKANNPDLGSHVANASYMTLPAAQSRGIGRSMAEYSLMEAKRLGYQSMVFNLVIKTNIPAINLWKKLGFEIKGEIPEAFNHHSQGLTDAYIMYKKL